MSRSLSRRLGPAPFVLETYGVKNLNIGDVTRHSWEILAILLKAEETNGIICDVGMLFTPLLLGEVGSLSPSLGQSSTRASRIIAGWSSETRKFSSFDQKCGSLTTVIIENYGTSHHGQSIDRARISTFLILFAPSPDRRVKEVGRPRSRSD